MKINRIKAIQNCTGFIAICIGCLTHLAVVAAQEKHFTHQHPHFTFTYPDTYQLAPLNPNEVLRLTPLGNNPAIEIGLQDLDAHGEKALKNFADGYANALVSLGFANSTEITSNQTISRYAPYPAYQATLQWQFGDGIQLTSLIHVIAKDKHLIWIAGHSVGSVDPIQMLLSGLDLNP